MASNSKKTVSVDTGAAKSSYRMSTLLSNKFNTFYLKIDQFRVMVKEVC